MKRYLLYFIFLFTPFFSILSRLISFFVPRDKNLWVFGAWYGERYEDNARYLFEHVKRDHPEIRAVWLAGNRKVLNIVRSKGHEAYLKNGLKGFLFTLKANVCILTHIPSAIWCDVNRFALTKRTRIIQLYHGIHIKKYETSPDKGALKVKIFRILFPEFDGYSLAIATSEETKRVFSSIFRVSPEKVAVTGSPRTDVIYNNRGATDTGGKRTILYAPTWRSTMQKELDLIEGYGFDVHKVSDFLSGKNAELLIRLHPNQTAALQKGFIGEMEQSGNIHFYHVEGIYEAMSGIDILISDYSSIYLDYLFMDRPVIFAAFDLEDFTRYQGFYYDYHEATPGPKAANWDEVLSHVKEAMEEPGKYAADRKRVLEFFYDFYDGDSSKRVFEEISSRVLDRRLSGG